jgi:hypothetical protein
VWLLVYVVRMRLHARGKGLPGSTLQSWVPVCPELVLSVTRCRYVHRHSSRQYGVLLDCVDFGPSWIVPSDLAALLWVVVL